MVGLEETIGTPLTTSATQLVDGAVNFIVAPRFEALTAPPIRLASSWPETVLGPVVGTSASPTVAILLRTVKGKVKLRLASKTEFPVLILLGPLLLGLLCPLLGRRRGVALRFSLQFWES